MGTTIKVPQVMQRHIWASVVIPLMVTIIPYGLIWAIYPPGQSHPVLKDFRFWFTGGMFLSGILSRGKIGLYQIGFLRKKENETSVDKMLTPLIYLSAGILLFFYIPAIILLSFVAHYGKIAETKKQISVWDKISHAGVIVMSLVCVCVYGWTYIADGRFPLGLAVITGYLTLVLILMGVAYFPEPKKISNAKRIIDGVIYMLAVAFSFVLGLPIKTVGEFLRKVFAKCSNHQGAAEYAGGVWAVILGWLPAKILSGKNLDDFPLLGTLIGHKTITVHREITARPTKGILGMFWKFVAFVKKMRAKVIKLVTGKEPKPKEKVVNTAVVYQIKQCIEDEVIVWITPPGRERPDDNGVLKRIQPANLVYVRVIQPIMCFGPMAYKPAAKKNKSGKKWYQQQWWVSPRIIWTYFLPAVYRFDDETPQEYSERIWVIMTNFQEKALAEIAAKERLAHIKLLRTKRKVVKTIKMPCTKIINLFNEYKKAA